jgi:uncharacterized protein
MECVLLGDVTELRATTHTIEFPYTRTLGPVIGPFFTGLRDGKILGIRDGTRVIVPPLEYDPDTGNALEPDFVEVGPGGTVTSWSWVTAPTRKHPLDHPFAFALIKLDGADTAMVHAVDAGSIDKMQTGMRVTPRWRAEPHHMVDDIEAWEPAT